MDGAHVRLLNLGPVSAPADATAAAASAAAAGFAALLGERLTASLDEAAPVELPAAAGTGDAPAAEEPTAPASAPDTGAAAGWLALLPPAAPIADAVTSTTAVPAREDAGRGGLPGVAAGAAAIAGARTEAIRLAPHTAAEAPAVPAQPSPETPATLAAPVPTPAPPPAPAVTIAVPVHAPEWREAVGDRVVLLARERVQSAELHVTPPELGPVSVRIDVDGKEASIVFGVQHPETRAAIADALPRLAEILAQHGLALGNAQVGAELARDRGGEAPRPAPGDAPVAGDAARDTAPLAARRGLVDLYA